MSILNTLARLALLMAVLVGLAACGLPRSGPYFSEVTDGEPPEGYGFKVVPLSPDVARITRVDEQRGFAVTFLQARAEAPYTLSRGDVLSVTVWENIDEGLLNPQGIGATPSAAEPDR